MRSVLAWAAGAVLCLAAPAAQAQNPCAQYVKFPAAGRWAEYRAVFNKKDPSAFRYAVVGVERREGTEYTWFEWKMSGASPDQSFVYQMLLPQSPLQMGQIQEVVMKQGSRPAMKISGMMMSMIRGQMEKSSLFKDLCKDVTLVGSESVTVPAGTFKALHYRSEKNRTDSWVSPDLPFAMVKSVGENHEIRLTGQGDGAESSITETPQEMPGPGPGNR